MDAQYTNSDIAEILEFNGKLLDLHDIDPDRAKTYLSSVYSIERLELQISGLKPEEWSSLGYYGRILKNEFQEILASGTTKELEYLITITPQGLFEVLKVKGLGIKKVKTLWKELGIEDLASLKKACENNSIRNLKGFGQKSQETIYESILAIESWKGKLRLDQALFLSDEILTKIRENYVECVAVGETVRIENIISKLSFLVVKEGFGGIKLPEDYFLQDLQASSPSTWRGYYQGHDIPIEVEKVSKRDEVSKQLILNSAEKHLAYQQPNGQTFLSYLSQNPIVSEEDAYRGFGFAYIIPEMRNGLDEFEKSGSLEVNNIISWEAITGTVHNHSTYSDGAHSLEQMAEACRKLGFSYFGIADHSQTATYAKGMSVETVLRQHQEIDQLNAAYSDGFKILKGIESDILIDGSLDYPEEILQKFDYVVASVHSVLTMDVERADARLIKAIENPYTSILGHPTGRILLRRDGYPISYKKIIDACAANGVVMELNASPYRLDLDWTWLSYCMEKGVLVSINPDAHSTEGLLDIKYGVKIARKAGLLKSMTLNALTLTEVLSKFKK